MLKYLQINDKDNLPELIDFNPFTAVVLVEEEVTVDWQAKVSEWLVASGCLYMMAWGKECSSWDDSVDWANIEKFDFSDIPDEFFVMTTWHENESVEEVFWFAKNCTYHDYLDTENHNALILHISSENKEKELVYLYENARCMLKAKFKMDDAYYRESLEQWIKYISKGRKYEPLLSVGLIVSGLLTINFLPLSVRTKLLTFSIMVRSLGFSWSIFITFKWLWASTPVSLAIR